MSTRDGLDELVDAFADGTLNRADLARARARMDATRWRLAGQAATQTLAGGARALREAWAEPGPHALGSGGPAVR